MDIKSYIQQVNEEICSLQNKSDDLFIKPGFKSESKGPVWTRKFHDCGNCYFRLSEIQFFCVHSDSKEKRK